MKTEFRYGGLRRRLGDEFDGLDIPDDAMAYRRFYQGDMNLDTATRTAIQCVSSDAVDSFSTIIDPAGMDMARFKQNPVVLFGHRYNEPPVGIDEDIWFDEDKKQIVARTKYAETVRGEEVWQLKREGILTASSITFVPTETKTPKSPDWDATLATYGLKRGDPGLPREIYTKSVLLEHSDVNKGANPDAVIISMSRGLTLSEDMRRCLGVEDADDKGEPKEDGTKEPAPIPAPAAARNVTREIDQFINRMKGRL